MRSTTFIDGTLHHLECADAYIGAGIGIAYLMRLSGQIERHSKKADEGFFPEADHFYIAKKRQVIEIQCANQGGTSAQRIWFEADVGVGEEQPFAFDDS